MLNSYTFIFFKKSFQFSFSQEPEPAFLPIQTHYDVAVSQICAGLEL